MGAFFQVSIGFVLCAEYSIPFFLLLLKGSLRTRSQRYFDAVACNYTNPDKTYTFTDYLIFLKRRPCLLPGLLRIDADETIDSRRFLLFLKKFGCIKNLPIFVVYKISRLIITTCHNIHHTGSSAVRPGVFARTSFRLSVECVVVSLVSFRQSFPDHHAFAVFTQTLFIIIKL